MRKYRNLAILALAFFFAGAMTTVMLLDREDARLKEIKRLEDVVKRLESERRVAEVIVEQQAVDPTTKRPVTTFAFTEIGGDGQPLCRRVFTVDGDVAYFDALVVKFEYRYAELGEALRGSSLFLFRRVFGEFQQPSQGFPLDEPTPIPYRLHAKASAFEREIWERFWRYATDPDEAAKKGIRVIQGEAVYTKLLPGRLYRLALEGSGGLNLHVENLPAVLRR